MADASDAEEKRCAGAANPPPPAVDTVSTSHQTTANKVGEECSKVGVTAEVLEKGWENPQDKVPLTKMMVAEIESFRQKQGKPFTEGKKWLERLLEPGIFDNVENDTLRSSLNDLKSKRTLANKSKKKKKCAETLQKLREELYTPPVPRQTGPNVQAASTSGLSMTQALKLKQENACLKAEVRDKDKEIKNLVIIQGRQERRESDLMKKEERSTKELTNTKRKLEESERKSKEKDANRSEVKNLNRKLRRRDEKIRKVKTGAKLLAKQLFKEAKNREKLRKKLTYHSKKRKAREEETIASLKLDVKQLKKQNSELLARVIQLETEQEEADELKHIIIREGPHKTSPFTNDLRLCCMKLLAHEVSANNLSRVIHDVLTTLCKYEISLEDLPGQKFCQLMRLEADLVTSQQVGEEMSTASNITLQSDGTSRNQEKYVDFEVTVAEGKTRTAGIMTTPSGESQDQLEAFNFILKKFSYLSGKSDRTTFEKELLSKIKNTMGDGAASQKHFNTLLQQYRQEILPDVIENWGDLTPEVQESLADMNHMYCQLHALIGFATYSDEALREVENLWREGEENKKLGSEGLREFQNKDGEYVWGRGQSATQRLIMTTCDAMAPGGNQQAGCMGEFNTYLDKIGVQRSSHIKPFRGNRFNVLFEAAAGVWYHRKHVQDMFNGGYHKAGNRLLRAVFADITSLPLLSGCRALGILYAVVTEPYWRLVTDARIHILDLSKQLQEALARFKEWSQDATPLLSSDIPPLFHINDDTPVYPQETGVYNSLYDASATEDEEMNRMTKEALEVMLANIIVVFERRFHAQLHGKYKEDNSAERREEMKNMQKTNMRGENDFGYFSYLQTSKPSISTMALEGQAMFKMNETAEWLNTLSATDPAKYDKVLYSARRNRRLFQKIYQDRNQTIKDRKKQKMEQRAAKAKEQENKKAQQEEDRTELLRKYGGPVACSESLENFLQELSTTPKTTKIKVIKAQITYLKGKRSNCPNDLFKFSSNKKQYTIQQLTQNLTTIISYPAISAPPLPQPVEETPPTPAPTREELNDRLSHVKAAFAKKANEARHSQEGVQHRESEAAGEDEGEGEVEEETREENKSDEPEDESSDGERQSEEDDESSEEESEEDETESSDGDQESADEEESSEDEESAEPPAKKSRSESETEMYFKVGNFVAVAFEDSWYIGQVEAVNGSSAKVNFLQRKNARQSKDAPTFFWPERTSVEEIDVTFIIHSNVEIEPDRRSNGRLWGVCGWEDILSKYNTYYNTYFALKKQSKKKR